MRPTVAILSTENLINNVEVARSIAKNSKILAMVKANGYGHGIRSVAMRIDHLVDGFGVSSIDEGLILRKVGIKSDIVLAEGIFSPDEIEIASENNFQIIINNIEQVIWLEDTSHIKNRLKIWIKIDTGLSRLGFVVDNDFREIEDIFSRIRKLNFIDDEIVLISHFACADQINHPLTLQQIEKFRLVSSFLEDKGFKILKSLCGSAGILNVPEYHHDIVRPGLMLYGASSVIGKTAKELSLKPVMQLETKILTTKIVKCGGTIGYGATHICNEDMKVGIIPIGYGDGYSRTFRTGTPVLVNNKICHIVGRIAMDMTAVDLTNAEDAKSGDRVILWSADLPIDEVAKYSNCVPYDLFTGIQHRVRFCWV